VPWEHVALLVGGGLVAGVVNTVAGGGSLLTVPLLHLVGLPGQLANGSNRVGVLAQAASATLRFHREGASGMREAMPLVVVVAAGSLVGAWGIKFLDDRLFEQLFGFLMLFLVVPTVWGMRPRLAAAGRPPGARWSRATQRVVFFSIGLYGGAVQAGVGLPLVAALAGSGYDLVRANSVKVVINLFLVLLALPIFLWRDLVSWPAALALAAGYAAGGTLGARLAVAGGERWLRPAVLLAVFLLAGHMLGLY
jgi:uncharacterized membrane protein YfcA